MENRGILWLVGGFLFCPCHLPVTLALLGWLLAGTVIGSLLRAHVVLAGASITLTWVLATWRGVRLLRAAGSCVSDQS